MTVFTSSIGISSVSLTLMLPFAMDSSPLVVANDWPPHASNWATSFLTLHLSLTLIAQSLPPMWRRPGTSPCVPLVMHLHNSPDPAFRAQNHPRLLIEPRRFSPRILPQTPNESRIGTPGLVQHSIMRRLAGRSFDSHSTRLAGLL